MKRTIIATLVVAVLVAGFACDASAKTRKPHTGPIRVLLMGDSLTLSYQDRLAELLGAGYTVTKAGVGKTGLLDVGVCNGARAKALLKQADADVAVVEYTGNYGIAGAPMTTDLPDTCLPHQVWGSKAWATKWKASATKTRNKLASKGAHVLFVLVPSSTRGQYAQIAPLVDAQYRKVAGTNVVDAWTAFGGATFDPALHIPDGLHLSPAGIELMAQTIAARVRA